MQRKYKIIVLSLKCKGALLNKVPSFVYSKSANLTAPLIPELINEAAYEDIYPNLLKIGRDSPIHKSGNKFYFKNCRPISVCLS